jgi:hypothetical protein
MLRWLEIIIIGLLVTVLVSCSSLEAYLGVDHGTDKSSQAILENQEQGHLPIPATAPPDQTQVVPQSTLILADPLFTPEPVDIPAEIAIGPSAAFYGLVFVAQPGSPIAIQNFSHSEAGCSWMGIGGQIFGIDGWPLQAMLVEIGGMIGNQPVSALALTGSALQWGPGGYEFTLGDTPIATQRTLWILVHDLDGRTLSDQIYFNTFADCNRNAILMNLIQVNIDTPEHTVYLNVLMRDSYYAEEIGGGHGE